MLLPDGPMGPQPPLPEPYWTALWADAQPVTEVEASVEAARLEREPEPCCP